MDLFLLVYSAIKHLGRMIKIKKIVITIKEKPEKNGDCSVNIKMEKSKNETEAEMLTASNVYQLCLGKLEELSKIQ